MCAVLSFEALLGLSCYLRVTEGRISLAKPSIQNKDQPSTAQPQQAVQTLRNQIDLHQCMMATNLELQWPKAYTATMSIAKEYLFVCGLSVDVCIAQLI